MKKNVVSLYVSYLGNRIAWVGRSLSIRGKCLLFLAFVSCLILVSSSQALMAQSTSKAFVFESSNKSLDETLKALGKTSGFLFTYSAEQVGRYHNVSIAKGNRNIEKTLSLLLQNTDLAYRIKGKNILIFPKAVAGNILMDKQMPSESAFSNGVRGVVRDGDNNPLAGVTVKVKNSAKGTITDVNGNFEIAADADEVLVFSYLGYGSQQVKVAGNDLVVNLIPDATTLAEVVAIGYGSVKKADLTGSISSVQAKDIDYTSSVSLDDALAGKAAGVAITKADGSPGGAVRMRIRGGTSLIGGVDPLYIIDGIPFEATSNYITSKDIVNPLVPIYYSDNFQNSVSGAFERGLNSLAGLNLNDIESIDILKDASATAIYGSKAANGVVIITTKKGKKDSKTKITLDYYTGLSQPLKEKLLNASQYKQALKTAAQNTVDFYNYNYNSYASDADKQYWYELFSNNYATTAQDVPGIVDKMGDTDTDWLKLILRTSVSHNVNLSLSGGSKTSSYYSSFSYTKQDGTIINTDFERYSAKVNLSNDLTKWARLTANFNLGYTKNNINNGVYTQALYAAPVASPYNADGSFNTTLFQDASSSFQNPLALATTTNLAKNYLLLGVIGLEADLTRNIKFKSNVSVNLSLYDQRNYIPSYVLVGGANGAENSGGGVGQQSHSTAIDKFFENSITYDRIFGEKHKVNLLLGTSWEHKTYSYFSAAGTGYPDDDFLNNLSSASSPTTIEGSDPASESSLLSFYARANYTFNEKYLLTFTGRSDTSSKFGPQNRTGFFPSGAIAWRVSEEDFLNGYDWIDQIKLRASIGKTGTQNIGDNLWRTLYSVGSYNGLSALYPSQLGNDQIKWETTLQKDMGLDFSFFNNRLGGTFGYYRKDTNGALLNITPAPSSGFTTVVYNLADVSNKGFEIELHGDYIRGRNWTWSGSLNLAHNKSKVKHINGNDFSDPQNRNQTVLGTSIIREGEELGLIYGHVVDGVIKTEVEFLQWRNSWQDYGDGTTLWTYLMPISGVGSGKFVYDEQQQMQKRDVIGHAAPLFYGGYTNTVSYKNLSLSAHFTFSYGNDLLYEKDKDDVAMSTYANRGVRVLRDFSSSNPLPNRPVSIFGSYASSLDVISSLNVYDASFLKLKTLTLNYSLPKTWSQMLGGISCTFYATASNLFTVTKYPGPDPEVSDDASSVIGGNRDMSTYPTAKTYIMGVRLTF